MEDGARPPKVRRGGGLEAIVGSANVTNDPAVLEEYSFDLSFAPRVRPGSVVKPGNAAEVREIVKWANATSTPLVPVSSGLPHFRGDTVPAAEGAVVVDFSRMKKIIRIDAKNWVALVEPGVTFAELQPELQKVGLAAYMPLCPRSSKSVVGCLLEREPITQPNHHWDSLDPMLCAEMVLGTGDMLRTGEAAGPDTIEEQWEIGKSQLNPFGPGQYDQNRLISGAQGTIGLVTWASLKCRPAAELSRAFLVGSDALEPLIELTYKLVRARLGNHCFIVNAVNLASLSATDPADIAELRKTLPRWILMVTFEGHGDLAADKLAYEEADFRDLLNAAGLEAADALEGVKAADLHRALNAPSARPYWKLRYKGGVQELFFQSTMDKSPLFVEAVSASADTGSFARENIGVYLQMMVQGTSCHCEFDFYHDPACSAEVERARRLLAASSERASRAGAFFSRPYGQWAELAYAQAPGTTVLHRKLKGIFDPNNILNPGKLCF